MVLVQLAEQAYTDQAHLIHDIRDLADITPSGYKPQSPQRNNHVPIVFLSLFFTIQADTGSTIVGG
jgi:hypothetical protein